VRRAFISVRNLQDWQAVLDRWYAEDLPGVHPPQDAGAAWSDCAA
jgi:hypothetical protein